jgi:hypothetical protein
VALDGLGIEPVAPDAGDEHLHGHPALAEARDLHRLGEVGGGVLDGVTHVAWVHLDLEPHAVVRELLDLRLHPSHSSRPLQAYVT